MNVTCWHGEGPTQQQQQQSELLPTSLSPYKVHQYPIRAKHGTRHARQQYHRRMRAKRTLRHYEHLLSYITMIRTLYQNHFFSGIQNFSLPAVGLISRSRLGCGARRGPACTPRCKCGSRPGSVARALGVHSREIWQVTTGSLSAEVEPSKTIENPHIT